MMKKNCSASEKDPLTEKILPFCMPPLKLCSEHHKRTRFYWRISDRSHIITFFFNSKEQKREGYRDVMLRMAFFSSGTMKIPVFFFFFPCITQHRKSVYCKITIRLICILRICVCIFALRLCKYMTDIHFCIVFELELWEDTVL